MTPEAAEWQQQLVKQPSKCELSFAQIVQSIINCLAIFQHDP